MADSEEDVTEPSSYPKAIVALAGGRDRYQLPLALHEGGLLQKLITEMYWPAEKEWFTSFLAPLLGQHRIGTRYCPGLTSDKVEISKSALCAFGSMKVTSLLNLTRMKDRALSRKARQIALREGAALFCYSYYAFDAFKSDGENPKHRFLFQLHPHPKTVRQLLLAEAERVPSASWSLKMEHELSLPAEDFEKLSSEPHLANGWVVASSYTSHTLSEHGIPEGQIHVVPYGVDGNTFAKRILPPGPNKPFTVIYVGSIIQRKGLSYLLDGVRLLKSTNIRVLLCGRGVFDRHLVSQYSDLNVEIRLGLPEQELISKIHQSDIFALPSLTEGFAHVILEAMSCGLPILATPHTCAPDITTEGVHGFIVPIRNAEAIAEKLAWGLDHRSDLATMGEAAAIQARTFTWERFKEGIRKAYKEMISSSAQYETSI